MTKSTADGEQPRRGRGGPERKPRGDGNIWIWPFELTEKIGEGGMAVVYRGRFVKNDTFHAVKLLPEELVANKTALARFKREMELLKQLRHPNVVRCFGGTAENGQPFYAMELVEGGTLDDVLRKAGRRTWRTTAECGLQMCAALECAHERGIVHRDVKPSNFLVDGDTLKLSDFGLALISSSTKITAADKTVGTFDYMAPEQITGRDVTPRTDLYALGCVFFEMLTGRPPFVADERVAILHQHLRSDPPSVADLAPQCPADFVRLVDDLLEKDPELRPESAQVVAERLQAILEGVALDLPEKTRTPAAARDTAPEPGAERTTRPTPRPVATTATTRPEINWLVYGLTLFVLVLLFRGFSLSAQLDQRGPGHDLLIELATNEEAGDARERLSAIEAVGKLGEHSDEAVDELVKLVDDENPQVRAAALMALGTAGGRARKHMALVRSTQRDDTETMVREAADQAWDKLEDSSRPGSAWWWLNRMFVVVLLGVVVAIMRPWADRKPRPAPTPKGPPTRSPSRDSGRSATTVADGWTPRRR